MTPTLNDLREAVRETRDLLRRVSRYRRTLGGLGLPDYVADCARRHEYALNHALHELRRRGLAAAEAGEGAGNG